MSTFVVDHIGQLLTLEGAVKKEGRHLAAADLGLVKDAALVVGGGKIKWSGARTDLPSKYKKLRRLNAKGRLVLPGFVDSHTHLVFAGDRSSEFEMRLSGKTYQDIAAGGGGIIKSMNATRGASYKDLLVSGLERVRNFLNQGVTTLEIKTGYGLNLESEEKCLKVIEALKQKSKATIMATLLSAHAVPPEFKNNKRQYVEVIARQWLPKLKKRVDFVDMFLDAGYFDVGDAEILFETARSHKIPIKLHADELQLTGGTETAIKYGALSADHLLRIGRPQIEQLAQSQTTATLLPTTAFLLKEPYAPARDLLRAGARVALASDFNPGTSPTQDICMVGLVAALQLNMQIHEIIVALTLNGAYALGLQSHKGALLEGFDADFIMLEAESPARLFQNFGGREVWAKGTKVSGK